MSQNHICTPKFLLTQVNKPVEIMVFYVELLLIFAIHDAVIANFILVDGCSWCY
jgi:hypothetical protein